MDRIPTLEHFRDAPPPGGDLSLTLSVGPIAVAVAGLSREARQTLANRYGPFLCETPPLHRFTIHKGPPAYLDTSPDGFLRLEDIPLRVGRCLLSSGFAAYREGREGRLLVADLQDEELLLMGVENALRWVVADLALAHGGFVLHAAGLVRNDIARLFFGPSGAGKSTVASLSPGCDVLSDDLVLLLRGGGGWSAAATPFAGTFPQERKSPGLHRIGGLYRLLQAEEDRLAPLSPALACGKVLAACPFVADPAARTGRLLPLVEDCCRAVVTMDLYFRKAPSFWGLIPREAGCDRSEEL